VSLLAQMLRLFRPAEGCYFPSAVPALQATIFTLPGRGPIGSLLFSNLKVGLSKMKVQT
jgi:hypothetical protein